MRIEVRPSPGKGRGVFATSNLPAGEVLERAYVTVLEYGTLDGTSLENHYWEKDGVQYITWGTQSLCNHSDDPNCECVMRGHLDYLITLRDVDADEELTIDYTLIGGL